LDRSEATRPQGATGGEHQDVFDELKNPWGFAGFCSQKAVVSQSSARMRLLVYHLWSLFVRVLKNQGSHTEAIKSRDELWFIPAKLVRKRQAQNHQTGGWRQAGKLSQTGLSEA
jgi:trans-2-enoyl-CoA reductase